MSTQELKNKMVNFIKHGRPANLHEQSTHTFFDERGFEIGYITGDNKAVPLPVDRIDSEETRKNVELFKNAIEEVDSDKKMVLSMVKTDSLLYVNENLKNDKEILDRILKTVNNHDKQKNNLDTSTHKSEKNLRK